MLEAFKNKIFNLSSREAFLQLALEIFRWQAHHNEVYKLFLSYLKVDPTEVKSVEEIPFLPIQFFKSHQIKTGNFEPQQIFTSSGSTGDQVSRHFVADQNLYIQSFTSTFKAPYGSVKDYCVLALLPAYLERTGSSLTFMVDQFIQESQHPESGFYLYNHQDLYWQLLKLKEQNVKTLLIGVSFALLDFAEKYPLNWPALVVMETGGMKGRKKEMTRTELHNALKPGFGVEAIHSEYGMTELLSQAYAKADGVYVPPPWMDVLVRDTTDPFMILTNGKTGGINVIDLANLNSCCFVATDDLGKKLNNNSFEVLGRFDYSDVRGCNLML